MEDTMSTPALQCARLLHQHYERINHDLYQTTPVSWADLSDVQRSVLVRAMQDLLQDGTAPIAVLTPVHLDAS